MAVGIKDKYVSAQPRASIKRASVAFEHKGGQDAQELEIENDRLKTSLMILTQKLKLKEDDTKGNDEKL